MIPAHRRMMLRSAPPATARVQVLGWDKVVDTYVPYTLWRSPRQAPAYVLEWDQQTDTYAYVQEWRPLA